jgi:hypothetical protein
MKTYIISIVDRKQKKEVFNATILTKTFKEANIKSFKIAQVLEMDYVLDYQIWCGSKKAYETYRKPNEITRRKK